MDKVIKKSYDISASVSEVWKALVDPRLIRQYFFGAEAVSEWEVGSLILYSGEWEGQKYQDKGFIISIIPEKELTMTHWSDRSGKPDLPENYTTHSYELTALGDNTQLNIVLEGHFEDNDNAWKHWDIAIKGLKKIVEK